MKLSREWFEAWAERHDVGTNLPAEIHPWTESHAHWIYLVVYDEDGERQALFWPTGDEARTCTGVVAAWNVETGERLDVGKQHSA